MCLPHSTYLSKGVVETSNVDGITWPYPIPHELTLVMVMVMMMVMMMMMMIVSVEQRPGWTEHV